MRSSSTFRGLPDNSEFFGSLNYLYGISDFWSFMFSDKEIVDRTLEATTYQLSDIYSKFLQLTSTVSLQDIRTTFHSQLKLLLIDEDSRVSDIEKDLKIMGSVETISELPPYQTLPFQEQRDLHLAEAFFVRSEVRLYVFNGYSWDEARSLFKYRLPTDAVSCRYLMDRPFLPKSVMENKVHYYLYPETHLLELHKSISEVGVPSRKVLKSQVIEYVEEISLSPVTYRIYLGKSGFYINVTMDSHPDLFEGTNTLSVKIGDELEYEVSQFALWATDIEIDEGAIWSYFGRFVNVSPATSTQMYRDFIKGLYFLYSRGPTLRLLQLGLNLCIGIPTARQTEKILHIHQDAETGNFNIVTANNNYTIPYGIPPDYVIGDTIEAGAELSQVAQIRDYKTHDNWWVNVSVPRSILPEYPTNLSTVATPGSTLEYYMRNFLKFNSFLVNIKLISGIGSTSISSITSLIDSAKAAYTLPIYVWQIPITQDPLKANDDDFDVRPTISMGEILLYGEMINRSKGFLPITDITTYPGVGLLAVGYSYRNASSGYISDGVTVLSPGEVATAVDSTYWKTPANNGERACGRWIRSNTDVTSYVGDIVDVLHGVNQEVSGSYSIVSGVMTITRTSHGLSTGDFVELTTVAPSGWYYVTYVDVDTFTVDVGDTPDGTGSIDYTFVEKIQDSYLIPLYNITTLELKQKLTAAGISWSNPLDKRFTVEVVDADSDISVYELFFAREDTSNPGLIGYNCGDIPPYVLEAKRRFLPDQADLTSLERVAFFEVTSGVYSTFLIRAVNTLFTPVYFPPRAEDALQITIDPIVESDTVWYEDTGF